MDASIRSRSAALAVIVHVALFLVLFFTLMKIQIPPFPEAGGGGGVLVNIGTLDEASGEIQPMSENITPQATQEKITPQETPEEKIATQDFEEAPVAKEVKETKKVTKNPEVKAVKEVKKTEPVRTVDSRAIYQGKTTTSKSQGTGKGAGDQGDPNGDPFSKYTGKNGTGGTGTGSGGGDGPGTGPGKGGFSFSLDGRRMVRSPQINDRSQETGKVVVDITVDKDGNVASAIPGGRGSTTTSDYLYKLAKEAALKARFNASPDDADIQKGTMTFVFVVQ